MPTQWELNILDKYLDEPDNDYENNNKDWDFEFESDREERFISE